MLSNVFYSITDTIAEVFVSNLKPILGSKAWLLASHANAPLPWKNARDNTLTFLQQHQWWRKEFYNIVTWNVRFGCVGFRLWLLILLYLISWYILGRCWFILVSVLQSFCTLPMIPRPGNTKGGSIAVPLTFCLTGLESTVWQQSIFVFICKTD